MGTYHVADVKYDKEKDILEILARNGERMSEGQLASLIIAMCRGNESSFKGRILIYASSAPASNKPEH